MQALTVGQRIFLCMDDAAAGGHQIDFPGRMTCSFRDCPGGAPRPSINQVKVCSPMWGWGVPRASSSGRETDGGQRVEEAPGADHALLTVGSMRRITDRRRISAGAAMRRWGSSGVPTDGPPMVPPESGLPYSAFPGQAAP